MRILGIDPGYAIVGYGIIDYNANHFSVVDYGAITTKAHTPFETRLVSIYCGMSQLISEYKPDAMSIEKLFFNTNTTTAIDVAQARGVIVLSAAQGGLDIAEYTPLQVKLELMHMSTHKSKNVSAEHLLTFYKTFDEVKHRNFDGMIITGAPVEKMV